MAASSASEYEKPPTGNAGEANQMSWRSSVAMTVLVLVVVSVIMVMDMAVIVAMAVPRATMLRAISAAFWFKRFFHRVHNQVH